MARRAQHTGAHRQAQADAADRDPLRPVSAYLAGARELVEHGRRCDHPIEARIGLDAPANRQCGGKAQRHAVAARLLERGQRRANAEPMPGSMAAVLSTLRSVAWAERLRVFRLCPLITPKGA